MSHETTSTMSLTATAEPNLSYITDNYNKINNSVRVDDYIMTNYYNGIMYYNRGKMASVEEKQQQLQYSKCLQKLLFRTNV